MHQLLTLVLLLSCLLAGQASAQADPWEQLKPLIGSWQGTSKGEPGEGTVEREYRFTLRGKFIEVDNKSTWKPTAQFPQGEVHEDRGFISYDRRRKTFVLRQFHVEGFVNQYVLDSLSSDGKVLVFTSESIENIAPGWRAREKYLLLNKDELHETFELAAPGKPFETYSESRLLRRQ